AHGRGFAGAIGPQEPEDLARVGVETDTIDRHDLTTAQIAKRLAEVVDVNHGRKSNRNIEYASRSARCIVVKRSVRSKFLSGTTIVHILIETVALRGHIARFTDGALDLFERQVVDGSRRGDHVLLDHEAAHVVGAEEKGELADLESLRDPRRLDVGNV